MNRSEITFTHTNLCLVTENLWWLLKSASLLEAHSQCVCQRFSLSFHHTALLHIKLWSMQTLYDKKNIAIAHTLLYAAVHDLPFYCILNQLF